MVCFLSLALSLLFLSFMGGRGKVSNGIICFSVPKGQIEDKIEDKLKIRSQIYSHDAMQHRTVHGISPDWAIGRLGDWATGGPLDDGSCSRVPKNTLVKKKRQARKRKYNFFLKKKRVDLLFIWRFF